MYLYCSPRGGFNDQLTVINKAITYCNKYNRTLLLDTTNSCYQINWSEYFMFHNTQCPIICDINKIRLLLHDKLTVYPSCLTGKLLAANRMFHYRQECDYCYKLDDSYIALSLPDQEQNEDVIVFCRTGYGNGYELFKSLVLNDNIKTYCKDKYSLIPNPYLGIQIRNTDKKCDYNSLYESNKELIHSYKTIYIATDCKEALDFFNISCINSTIFNFTTFEENRGNKNLHYSNINNDTKMKDLLCDIYMITMCDKFITNSKGGFVHLLKQCHNNDYVKSMFLAI
jgi:hypothetical protein